MNLGKTLFSQLMDFLPWSTFTRIVALHDGDHHVKSLNCTDQFRAMAFAQLTYRESLRDIEAVCRRKPPSAITWGFATTSNAQRWPMPTKYGVGISTPRFPSA